MAQPDIEIGQWQMCRPFMQTQKEQINHVKQFHVMTERLEECEKIVKEVLSGSSFLTKERIEKISKFVGNRSRLLKNYINAKSE